MAGVRRVVVLSAAPAIDRTLVLDSLSPGHVHRPEQVDERAGGKGANVVRALGQLGVEAVLLTAVGGPGGAAFRELARREGLALHVLPAYADTRTCTTFVTGSGILSAYEPAPVIGCWDQLAARAPGLLEDGGVLVVSGSLPPDVAVRGLVGLAGWARAQGHDVLVDVSADALPALCPHATAVYPNRHEVADVLGVADRHETHDSGGEDAVVGRGAALLTGLGAGAAVISCGSTGALHHAAGVATMVPAPPGPVVNTVGAGDVLLAASLAAALARTGTGRLSITAGDVAQGVRTATASCASLGAGDLALPP